MERTKLLKPIVYLTFFLYFADALADKFYWYYSIWWFDMPMHFFGGFWVGMFFFWYFSEVRVPFWREPVRDAGPRAFLQAFLFLLLVGIAWEAGEYLTSNYIGLEPFVMFDAVSDVFFDLAGGFVALVYTARKIMPPGFFKVQSS